MEEIESEVNEFPSIANASRAPHLPCIAFEKLDGNNIRIKYTAKRGFHLYGSRTQLFDATHPEWGEAVRLFEAEYREPLERLMGKEFPNEREAVAFGELYGEKTFAGVHTPGDPKAFVLFDLLVGHKQPRFLLPQEFIKLCGSKVRIPKEVYRGNMNAALIADVRANKFGVNEGIVCKGTQRTQYAFGGVWMCKIKTQAYLDRVFASYGEQGLKQFGE